MGCSMGSGALTALAPFGDAAFNLWATMWGNQRAEGLSREAVGQLSDWNDQSSQRFDLSNFKDRSGLNPDLSWSALQDIFANTGDTTLDTFNDTFGEGQDWKAVLSGANKALDPNFKAGPSWSGAGGEMSRALADRDWFGGEDMGTKIGGYFGDESFDAWLAAQKGTIGTQSEARQGAGNRSLLGWGLGAGKSLEEMGGALESANIAEGAARGQAGLNAEASREGMSAQYRAQKAAAQSQAAMSQATTEAGIASDLAKARASGILGLTQGESAETNAMNQLLATLAAGKSKNIMDIGSAEATERLQSAGQQASLRGWDINAETQRNRDIFSSWDRQNTQNLDTARWLEGTKLNSEDSFRMAMAQILAGIPVTIPNSNAFQQSASNMLAYEQMNKEPKGGGGLGFLTFSYSQSCVAGTSTVTTPTGTKMLRDVTPGEQVLGEDMEYHRVVAKDYGYVPEGQRHQTVMITAGPESDRPIAFVVASEHHIEGKLCSDFHVGDRVSVESVPMVVASVTDVPYVMSGDLMLEDNVRYIANGFAVDSEIGRSGLNKWRRHLADNGGSERDGFVHGAANPRGCFAILAEKSHA